MKIRALTGFVSFTPAAWDNDGDQLKRTLGEVAQKLGILSTELSKQAEVQTVRVSCNNPLQWLPFGNKEKLAACLTLLDGVLESIGIHFFNFGRLVTSEAAIIANIPFLVTFSSRFNLSLDLSPTSHAVAKQAADVVLQIATETNGYGNFRFCVSSCIRPGLPFFPASCAAEAAPDATEATIIGFALGLENGDWCQAALQQASSLAGIHQAVSDVMLPTLKALESTCEAQSTALSLPYLGLDTSLNPGLDDDGSVGKAFEFLPEVTSFGGSGTLAAVAASTRAIQALPIKQIGYCGLMLPVCEDQHLAAMSMDPDRRLSLAVLLQLSSVCGVGLDTVPVPGDVAPAALAGLFLDVAALATRWNKPLSCRVFPLPGCQAGDRTDFADNPHLVDACVFECV
eukprot:m.125931 g.125931  ORF g.125931 m.125931 type:complete len:399 (-) comp15763_c0_seq2:1862-3058(-)